MNKKQMIEKVQTRSDDLTRDDEPLTPDQAKEYTLSGIERLRRKAVRGAVKECGYLILARIIEEIYCTSRDMFDANSSLTDYARAAAWDTLYSLMEDGQVDYLLDSCITSDVYHQICADRKDAFDREKKACEALQDRSGREPTLVTVRFTVGHDAPPITLVINIDELTPVQRGWLEIALSTRTFVNYITATTAPLSSAKTTASRCA